jgi:tetratricopeptide (TPR) repeat protein
MPTVMANIRPIVLASVLCALGALGTLYEGGAPEWKDALAAVPGTAEPDATKLIMENWPICSSIGVPGPEADWAELDPDFAAGKKALAKSEWTNAITALNFAAMRDPRNADIQNYIGYAHWRAGGVGPAMGHFQQALAINPRHRGAHEHLGELFLTLKDAAQAEAHLAALKQICLIPCQEFANLQQAIEADRGAPTR